MVDNSSVGHFPAFIDSAICKTNHKLYNLSWSMEDLVTVSPSQLWNLHCQKQSIKFSLTAPKNGVKRLCSQSSRVLIKCHITSVNLHQNFSAIHKNLSFFPPSVISFHDQLPLRISGEENSIRLTSDQTELYNIV